MADAHSENYSALDAVVTAQRRIAEAHLALGELKEASVANASAETTAEKLIARDPKNANWGINAAYIQRMKSALLVLAGDTKSAIAAADRSVDMVTAILTVDAPQSSTAALGQSLALRLDLLGASASDADAGRVEAMIIDAIAIDPRDYARFIGAASASLANFEHMKGRPEGAATIRSRAIAALEPIQRTISKTALVGLARLYLDAGFPEKAAPIISEAETLGIKDPAFLSLREKFLKLAAN